MDVSGTATDLDASDPACAIQSVSCENSLSESMDVSQTACDPNASEPACAKQSESTDNNGQEAMEFSLTAQAEETAVKDAEKICFSCDKARDYALLQRAAFILRRKLLNISKKPLPNDL
ncbi:uncharacterized protein LOC112455939 isoform X2 [Temnothorax curvispinosus]|uniref:Uncharacterized protein LOC112455939 isoform X2 n=1 Tax=Temnothorax curvispinosus TaxID=300111 RepID=A0A6J1PYV4_9HYME|nr:uncharacterized protein LOC112455939 isoform X2 [Temnothorax curvispinosus]